MRSLTLVRRIAARPSIVFEAMTTAEGVAAWFGPDDLPVVRAEMDARVGGAYRVHFRTLDGRDHEARGEFLEVVPPRRIVMSWSWAVGGELEEGGRISRVEIELTPIGDGTELTFTHAALCERGLREEPRAGLDWRARQARSTPRNAAAATNKNREELP